MRRSRTSQPAAATAGRRRSVARVLSPRGAFTLHQVDGAFTFALRAALAMALAALPLVVAGRPEDAVYGMLGAFTTTFGRNLPYPRRARALALVALAMTACVAGGSALAAWAQPREQTGGAAVVIAATALVAGAAKFVCDATRLRGLGAVLLLFAFAVAANSTPAYADIPRYTVLTALGAAAAWVLAVLGVLVHPDRPQRLAVAAALRALAALRETPLSRDREGAARTHATAAVLRAYQSVGLGPPAPADPEGRGGACARLTDLSWSLLIGSGLRRENTPVGLAHLLRAQARVLADRRRRTAVLLPELARLDAAAPTGAGAPSPARRARGRFTELRAAQLAVGPGPGDLRDRLRVLVVPALRMVLGTGLAGGIALALDLGHGYWAAISAAAVLHSVNVRTASQRAVQRAVGTTAGLVIAFGVLAAGPTARTLILVIVVLEFLLEYVVARNYGLGIVFLTPLALLLSDLAGPEPAGALVLDRAAGSAIGIVVGLACALLVVHDHASVRAVRALAACERAADRARDALADGLVGTFPVAQARLAAAVVELREADDAAAGELLPAELDPAALAAAEQRAYLLLERLAR
ncbi:FUSC family protein [Streptomyces sp. BV333]|uniref:FUSC family protein n=1 Tax=Streptomyces sp. BV333 TaxID=2849673 RepID=UPI001C2E2E19|nr:FUSC family protein [Streptomyces sp. BV333]MBV1956839.1 FUSC family protein [Streptomyces sp. BV333]